MAGRTISELSSLTSVLNSDTVLLGRGNALSRMTFNDFKAAVLASVSSVTIGSVTGLTAALDAKADLVDGKIPAEQLPLGGGGGEITLPIAMSDVSGLSAALDGKAPSAHTHAISGVTGLQSALDAKAATTHTHTASQISDATSAGRGLLTAADATAQRSALGLGTAAVASIGTTAGAVVALDGTGKLPAVDASQLTNLPQSGGGAALPVGLIAMWSGASNAIPTGWALCNGANGTPDLRNRFVIGAGSTYAVGATGGATSHTHTVGSTALTEAQMPNHTHSVNESPHQHTFLTYDAVLGVAAGNNYNVVSGATKGTTGTSFVTTGLSLYSAGGGQSHTHTLTSADALPPYYALCFIMKT